MQSLIFYLTFVWGRPHISGDEPLRPWWSRVHPSPEPEHEHKGLPGSAVSVPLQVSACLLEINQNTYMWCMITVSFVFKDYFKI